MSTVTAAPAAAAAAAAAAEHQAMEPRHFPFTSDILYGLGKELVVTATKIRILHFYNRPIGDGTAVHIGGSLSNEHVQNMQMSLVLYSSSLRSKT